MRLVHVLSPIVAVSLAACALGSHANDQKSSGSAAKTEASPASPAPSGGGATFEKPPEGQHEGEPPPDKSLRKGEARPPATDAPDGGNGGKAPSLPPGFLDAGPQDAGKAKASDGGKA